MNTQETPRGLLRASLERWAHASSEDGDAIAVEVALRHVEVFALATCAQELHEIRLTLQARHEEAIDRAENLAQRRRSEGAETSAHRPPESHPDVHAEPAPRQHDTPCLALHPGGMQRCTRRQAHAGEHVDAAGRRWGGEA